MTRFKKNLNHQNTSLIIGIALLIVIAIIVLVLAELSFLKRASTTDSKASSPSGTFNAQSSAGSLMYKGTKSNLQLVTSANAVKTGTTFPVRVQLSGSSAHAVLLEVKYNPALLSVKEINSLPQFPYLSAKNINNSTGTTTVLAGVRQGYNIPPAMGDVVEFKFTANKPDANAMITLNESSTKTFVNGLNSLGTINNLTLAITQ